MKKFLSIFVLSLSLVGLTQVAYGDIGAHTCPTKIKINGSYDPDLQRYKYLDDHGIEWLSQLKPHSEDFVNIGGFVEATAWGCDASKNKECPILCYYGAAPQEESFTLEHKPGTLPKNNPYWIAQGGLNDKMYCNSRDLKNCTFDIK